MLRQMLIPLDGSPEAASVLPTATTLAGAVGARIRLLHVVPGHTPHSQNVPDVMAAATQDLNF